jgi:hypothetical protein
VPWSVFRLGVDKVVQHHKPWADERQQWGKEARTSWPSTGLASKSGSWGDFPVLKGIHLPGEAGVLQCFGGLAKYSFLPQAAKAPRKISCGARPLDSSPSGQLLAYHESVRE